MANRVYYASHGVQVNGNTVEGAQSAGVTANFTLEQAFQLGKINIYDNFVTDAEAGISVSKVLDGNDTIFKLFTESAHSCIADHASTQRDIRIAASNLDSATTLATGNQNCIQCTGAYLSSISYNIPVDGFATEEISFVADNKSSSTGVVDPPDATTARVSYRQMVNLNSSDLPAEVDGQNITNISFSTDYGREAMYKLGSFSPYFRFANFPFEVTVDFTVANTGIEDTAVALTGVTALSDGGLPAKTNIKVVLDKSEAGNHGYEFSATGCRLTSVSQDGGDTGGGNASTTYSYTTFNEFCISG